jgi:hypothetical protein
MKKTYLYLFLLTCITHIGFAGQYKNFAVSIYARAYEVNQMDNQQWLDSTWNIISKQLKVDKIYLETHRDKIIVSEATLEKAKNFFLSKGLIVAGGITYTMDESNRFETFCYTNPDHRKKAKQIAELTARHFDEIILDDFFFTSCKCELCIKAKGPQSWSQYRLNLMNDAAENLIIKPAKAVNSKVKVIIKYPNWYEHFQGLGFNLEDGPRLFDGIYTGTETRDPVFSQQHLQPYESYLVYRYYSNLKRGKNGGGWVDPFASFYMDRYAEQLWLTLFSKAPEITLFDYRMMLVPINKSTKAAWQNGKTSFDFDQMTGAVTDANMPVTYARAAGYSFDKVDRLIGLLGNPVGIKNYKPYHSKGEDFIQNYFGMLGIPMDIESRFPTSSDFIILTESAAYDKDIVAKIKQQLVDGKNVLITSGLLNLLQGKGIEDIVELQCSTRKAIVDHFGVGRSWELMSSQKILIPQVQYLTNDSWEEVTAYEGASGWPILHQAAYGNGNLFVLVVPENFSDLYQFPAPVLNRIRRFVSQEMPLYIEGPSQVSVFIYSNGTFIVESFLPEEVKINVVVKKAAKSIVDLSTDEKISGTTVKEQKLWRMPSGYLTTFEVTIPPHSYKGFKIND